MPPRRRSLRDDDAGSAFMPPTREEKFDGASYTDPAPLGGDDLLRQIELDREGGAFDNPVAGNPDAPRSIFGGGGGPRTFAPPAAPPATLGSSMERFNPDPGPQQGPDAGGDILSMLPQGVEATSSEGTGQASGVAPLSPATPQSVSVRGTPPATVSGPQRQSVSSPMQFGSSGGRSLIGRGSGQFGGGIGLPGGQGGGPQATEQMKAILEALGLG